MRKKLKIIMEKGDGILGRKLCYYIYRQERPLRDGDIIELSKADNPDNSQYFTAVQYTKRQHVFNACLECDIFTNCWIQACPVRLLKGGLERKICQKGRHSKASFIFKRLDDVLEKL